MLRKIPRTAKIASVVLAALVLIPGASSVAFQGSDAKAPRLHTPQPDQLAPTALASGLFAGEVSGLPSSGAAPTPPPDPVAAARATVCSTFGTNPALPCEAWATRYCGPACSTRGTKLVQSPDGKRLFAIAYDYAGGQYRYMTVASNAATGARVWTATYRGDGNYLTLPEDISVSPDGSKVFVTGFVQNIACCLTGDYGTVAYNATTGALLWVARYDGGGPQQWGFDEAHAVSVSPDGAQVFVTGWSSGLTTGLDMVTIGYDAATGAQLWLARSDSDITLGAWDTGTAVITSPDGSTVLVLGDGDLLHHTKQFVVALDAHTGAQKWATVIELFPDGYENAIGMVLSPDGTRMYATSIAANSQGKEDVGLTAYDGATGAVTWSAVWDGPAHSNDGALAPPVVSADGSHIFVTGASLDVDDSTGKFNYATLAFDAGTGANLWSSIYDDITHNHDVPTGVALSPDGARLYVTGRSYRGIDTNSGRDLASVSYDAASGAQIWVNRYNGLTKGDSLSFTLGKSIVVAPDSQRAFMVGYSVDAIGGAGNMVTVAYNR